MTALAVSGVSTGWATGGLATASGLCETFAIAVRLGFLSGRSSWP
jgi:hypothetical protein